MKILHILLLLFPLLVYTQDTKKEILLDSNNENVSDEFFLKEIKKDNIGYSVFDNDSILFLKLVESNKRFTELFEHYQLGKINESNRELLIKELNSLTESNVKKNDIIIINFFRNEEALNLNQRPMISAYTSTRNYSKFFRKTDNLQQFFITEKSYNFNRTIKDNNGVIENIFFKTDKPTFCDYVIIFPDNNFILKIGEYRIEMIRKFIEEYQDGKLKIFFN